MMNRQHWHKLALRLLFFGVSVIALGLSPQVSALSQSQPSSGNMTICPGIDPAKTTAIDLVVLIDDSRSLSSTKNDRVPSDPDGNRFDALETMFESINAGLENRVPVIPKFFAFGTSVKELNPKSGLGNPSALEADIRELLPIRNQEPGTNFQKALDRATDYLTSRSPSNCKFLVWFTDGVFDLGSNDKEKEEEALVSLKNKTCSSNGWAVALRKAGVNTYVVLLGEIEKLKKDDTDKTFDDSLNLMVELTGDPTPPQGVQSERCGELSHAYDQVGAIYSATDLDQLTAVFEQIGKFISQSKIVVCPTTSKDQVQTGKMPDLKFIDSFSLISIEGSPLPREDQIDVVVGNQELAVTEYFEITLKSKSHLQFVPVAGRKLNAGWMLQIEKTATESLSGLCITAAFQNSPTVQITQLANGEPEVKEVVTDVSQRLLSDEDLSSVVFAFEGAPISASEVMQKNVSGQLDSAKLALLSAGLNINGDLNDPVFSTLFPIFVEVKLPRPDFSECLKPFTTSRAPVSGDTPNDRDFLTNSCKVSTSGLSEGNELQISIEKLIADLKLNEGCKDIESSLRIGEKKVSGEVATVSAGVETNLQLNFKVGEKVTECNFLQYDGIQFIETSTGQSVFGKIAIEFSFREPPPLHWVRFWTVVLVLLAAVMSLLLLRLISAALAVMPKRQVIYSYDKEIEIGRNAFGQVLVQINGVEIDRYQPSVDDLSKPHSSSSNSQLVLNKVKIERKLGRLFKPLSEPWAVLPKSQVASYWQQSANGGLAIPFRRAVIVSKLEIDRVGEDRIKAQLTIIVPSNGNGSGISGVASLMHGQKIKDVCKEFSDKVKSSENEFVQSDKKNDQSGGIKLPNGGVKLPSPPPIPNS